MDLQLYARVMWRFRLLVALGVLLAAGLAVLSMARISTDGKISYRQSEQWVSYSRFFVTEQGFPWGRLSLSGSADPSRFANLALIYANFADTDEVKQLIRKQGPPIRGHIEAAAVLASQSGTDALPIVSVAGIAESKRDSLELTRRGTNALLAYIRNNQHSSDIPDNDRIMVQVIQAPGKSKLIAGRSKTMPIVVFLGVLSVAIGLAFVLENLRPRARVLADSENALPQRRHLSA
jgi:hypothetical protein